MIRRLLATTRGRLVLLSVAVLAAGVTIADGGLYSWLTFSQRADTDAMLQRQATAVVAGLRFQGGAITYRGQPLPGEAGNGVAIDAAVMGTDGVLAQSQEQPLLAATLAEVAAPVLRTGRPIWVDLVDAHHVQRRVYVSPVALPGALSGALVVSRSVGELQTSLLRTMVVLGLLSATIVALGGILAYWLAGRILRPVHDIAALASTLSQQELHRRVDVPMPDDELGELVSTFNGMLARLETSFQTLRSFTADASHELRAPLTVMSTELQVSLSRERTAAQYQQTLEVVADEVKHLTGIVEGLLYLARADAGQLRPDVSRLDVVDLVHETVGRWSATAEVHGVRVEAICPPTGLVEADPQLTRRVLDNLVDNAIKHSPVSGRVVVEAGRTECGWRFSVTDEGPGVSPSLAGRIFSRFARGDPARTRPGNGVAGGTGLGLALSQAVARAQGGDLMLVETDSGARFELLLPDRNPVG